MKALILEESLWTLKRELEVEVAFLRRVQAGYPASDREQQEAMLNVHLLSSEIQNRGPDTIIMLGIGGLC